MIEREWLNDSSPLSERINRIASAAGAEPWLMQRRSAFFGGRVPNPDSQSGFPVRIPSPDSQSGFPVRIPSPDSRGYLGSVPGLPSGNEPPRPMLTGSQSLSLQRINDFNAIDVAADAFFF